MSNLFWLTEAKMTHLRSFFLKVHGTSVLTMWRFSAALYSAIAMVFDGLTHRKNMSEDLQ